MNKQEAMEVLRAHLAPYRSESYAALQRLLGSPETTEVRGPSGTSYQIEVQAGWDDRPGGNLRVVGGIDDGGWRAFVPLSDSFIVAPDGSFVGE
jgi:hypothetical protein